MCDVTVQHSTPPMISTIWKVSALLGIFALFGCNAESPPPLAPSSVASSRTTSEEQPKHPALATEITVTWKLELATETEGKQLLGESDSFSREMSDFDRQIRMSSSLPVKEKDFLAHCEKQVIPWTEQDKATWTPYLHNVQQALLGLNLSLPKRVFLIHTTGKEEFGLPHTRKNAIVLPTQAIQEYRDPTILLAHELFHVAIRHDPKQRERLYPLTGFSPGKSFSYPPSLNARRITNPDAFDYDFGIHVQKKGQTIFVHPILQSKLAIEQAYSKNLMEVLDIQLLELPTNEAGTPPPSPTWKIHTIGSTNYFEIAKKGQDIPLHPQEILADQFGMLIARRLHKKVSPPAPAFLDKLETELQTSKLAVPHPQTR
jgi:hypothetical protein